VGDYQELQTHLVVVKEQLPIAVNTRNKNCYIVANDNFTILNNFNTISFRQNDIYDLHVEALTGVGFVEAD
jgi:hypothetical protein